MKCFATSRQARGRDLRSFPGWSAKSQRASQLRPSSTANVKCSFHSFTAMAQGIMPNAGKNRLCHLDCAPPRACAREVLPWIRDGANTTTEVIRTIRKVVLAISTAYTARYRCAETHDARRRRLRKCHQTKVYQRPGVWLHSHPQPEERSTGPPLCFLHELWVWVSRAERAVDRKSRSVAVLIHHAR